LEWLGDCISRGAIPRKPWPTRICQIAISLITVAANGLTNSSVGEAMFSVMTVTDLSTAESAFLVLLHARLQPRIVAAELVRALRSKTKNTGQQSHEVEIIQADAWLAICALSKSLDTEDNTSLEVWSRAIKRTEEWRNILD
jgi:hypothetical protein